LEDQILIFLGKKLIKLKTSHNKIKLKREIKNGK